jgi:stage IV sporulation protein FB
MVAVCLGRAAVFEWAGVRGGYFRLGSWRGAPVRAHWTMPLGAFVFGRGRFVPGFWLGFVLVVLIHELGHALVVRRFGHRVVAIDLHALGGECRWAGDATPLQRARIAWGGVNAQLVALIVAVVVLAVLGPRGTAFVDDLADALTFTNAYMIALNLIPVAPLDGAAAWKLPGLLRARARARKSRRESAARAPGSSEGARTAVADELARLDASEQAASSETAAAVDAKLRELVGGAAAKKP